MGSVNNDLRNILASKLYQNVTHSTVPTSCRTIIRFKSISFMLLEAAGEGDEDVIQLSAPLDRSLKRNVNDGRCFDFVSSLSISVLLIIIAFSFMSSPSHRNDFDSELVPYISLIYMRC